MAATLAGDMPQRLESAAHSSEPSAPALMIFTDEIKDWLPWVIKIRFVIIIFVFAIDYAIRQLHQSCQRCFHPLSGDGGHSLVHPQPVLPDLQSTQP